MALYHTLDLPRFGEKDLNLDLVAVSDALYDVISFLR
jgi:hypothetical protein